MDNTTESKKRQQLTDILNIHIPPARCFIHIKNILINETVDAELKQLRSEEKKLKLQKQESPENTDITNQLQELVKKIKIISKELIHIRTETSITIATICDYFIENLVKNVLQELVQNNKKNFDVSTIIEHNHENSLYYSILNKLPSYANYDAKKYEEYRKEQQELNKKNKKEKLNEENTTSPPNEESVDNENKENNKIYFTSYVTEIIKVNMNQILVENNKDIKKDSIKITKDAKIFLSKLIIECIKRFITLAKIIVKNFSKVKTISSNHLKTVIHLCLADEGKSDGDVLIITNLIDDKLKLYNIHNKVNKNKNDNDVDVINNETKESDSEVNE